MPVLRFPDFRNSEGWKVVPFDKVFERLTDKNKENNQNVLTISAQLGLVSQLEYFNKKVSAKDLSGYYLLHKGDFAYNKSYSKGYPMGAIKPLKSYDKGVVSTLYICFRAKYGFVPEFYEQYFDSGVMNCEIEKIAQEGGRAHGLLNVSVKEFFRDVAIYVPLPKEQQKIGDFLSATDKLIGEQTKKLNSLKTHKKGLVRQLFPQGNETTPKLRFPEYVNDDGWIASTIANIASISSGGTPSRTKNEYWGGEIPWVSTTLIDFNTIYSVNEYITDSGIKNSSAKLFAKNTILMAMYGQGKTRGQVAKLGIEASINQACAAFRLNDSVSTDFVFQNLAARYEEIREISNDGGQKNLSATLIKKIPFFYPDIKTGEQQKISKCLASIDKLIEEQTKKVQSLKCHKKGLMQKLFPTMDEVDV